MDVYFRGTINTIIMVYFTLFSDEINKHSYVRYRKPTMMKKNTWLFFDIVYELLHFRMYMFTYTKQVSKNCHGDPMSPLAATNNTILLHDVMY